MTMAGILLNDSVSQITDIVTDFDVTTPCFSNMSATVTEKASSFGVNSTAELSDNPAIGPIIRMYGNYSGSLILPVVSLSIVVCNMIMLIYLRNLSSMRSDMKLCIVQMGVADAGMAIVVCGRGRLFLILSANSGLQCRVSWCMIMVSTVDVFTGVYQSAFVLFAVKNFVTIRRSYHQIILRGTGTNYTSVILGGTWLLWVAWSAVPILCQGDQVFPTCHYSNGLFKQGFHIIKLVLYLLHVVGIVIIQLCSVYLLWRRSCQIYDIAMVENN